MTIPSIDGVNENGNGTRLIRVGHADKRVPPSIGFDSIQQMATF